MRKAERFTSPVANHGEGPFWDGVHQRLLCMDVFAAVVVEIDPLGVPTRHKVPSRAASVIRRRAAGGFVVATEHGIVVTDDAFSTFTGIAELALSPEVRTNDGGCDPLGGFVIGTMAYDASPGRGAVYRLSPEGRVTKLLAPVTISNGVQWSSDGERVYYIDTPTRRVDVLDVDAHTGAWRERRTHITVSSAEGFPDGMAIDEEGGLWIALWGGGAVNHYDAAGQLVESVEVPGVSQVSACTFGGEQRNILYITTSRQDLPDSDEPNAGSVFAVATTVRGAALPEFAG